MTECKRKTMKLLPFYMTDILFTELKKHCIWKNKKSYKI